MKNAVIKEIENLIKIFNYNCSVQKFKDYVEWHNISQYKYLSEDFIREFKDKVDWDSISAKQTLSEDFIREFKDYVDWEHISYFQKLSEDFIREFKDKVNWNYISIGRKLSEEFIREFKDKVDWNRISSRQKLSEDFIREFKDKVDWYFLVKNPYCPPKLKIQYLRDTGQLHYEDPKIHDMDNYNVSDSVKDNYSQIAQDIQTLKALIAV